MSPSQRNRPLLGAHVSVAGGLHKGFARADELGVEAIQIFGASPRSWSAPMPKKTDLKLYEEARAKSKVQEVYLHGAYLVNMASTDAALRARSIKNLTAHLAIAHALQAQGVIFHPGSAGGQLREDALAKVVEGMQQVLEAVPGPTCLIMENTAGGGNSIGGTPEELGWLLKQAASARVKVCIDTAHSFEAGLVQSYTEESTKELFDAFDEQVGLANVVTLHVNDSKSIFNSHLDRHENLGEGFIGLDGFRALAAEKRLYGKAWLLEVPGFEDMGPDKKNVELLRDCFPEGVLR
jgi:deoxyribonuclease-4